MEKFGLFFMNKEKVDRDPTNQGVFSLLKSGSEA